MFEFNVDKCVEINKTNEATFEMSLQVDRQWTVKNRY